MKKTTTVKKTPVEHMRAQRIEAYREMILREKEAIAEIESERDKLFSSGFDGISVKHKLYGEGRIVRRESLTITVAFGNREKQFILPRAFLDGFLKTDDAAANATLTAYSEKMQAILAKRKEKSVSPDNCGDGE